MVLTIHKWTYPFQGITLLLVQVFFKKTLNDWKKSVSSMFTLFLCTCKLFVSTVIFNLQRVPSLFPLSCFYSFNQGYFHFMSHQLGHKEKVPQSDGSREGGEEYGWEVGQEDRSNYWPLLCVVCGLSGNPWFTSLSNAPRQLLIWLNSSLQNLLLNWLKGFLQ